MPFEVRPLPEISAIELRLWGKLNIEDLRTLSAEVMTLAKTTGYRRALADCRDYLGGSGLGEVYFLAEEVTRRPGSERGVEALIALADALAAADVQFYATAARNRGTVVRVFAERQAATEWLLQLGQAYGRPVRPEKA